MLDFKNLNYFEWFQKNKEQYLLFECISGSRAYGTDLPTSDTDIRGVYIEPLEWTLSLNQTTQISDEKNDTTYYELGTFLKLVQTNNPNILELLNVPEDCILYKHPLFDEILANKEKFLSKICKASFGGYAYQQIEKARGLNKKIVNPVEKERKTPLDFCYVTEKQGSIPVTEWLNREKLDQQYVGLAAIPHMRDTYGLYYDMAAHTKKLKEEGKLFSAVGKHLLFGHELMPMDKINVPEIEEHIDNSIAFGYKGIIQGEDSNDISLSSIAIDELPYIHMYYNKDGYSKYCKDYKEYWDWVEKRNPVRYGETIEHSKNYDAKNTMHCIRLLQVGIEIATTKQVNVRRPNREYLLQIRKGELSYEDLIAKAEVLMKEMDGAFQKCDLPLNVDHLFINELLVKLRKKFYNLNE